MDIDQYLSEKQAALDKGADRIRNFEVFDFNYVPEKPLMREEVKPVIDALLRYQQTGIANNVLVLGSRGSGKSVLARCLMNLMSQQGQAAFAYANCRQHNTSVKILAALLGLRPRGSSLDELWQRFENAHEGRVVFVLDEVDLISEKDRHKDILYLLSRSTRNYMAVLLSNNPKFLNLLDESIKSTLQPEIVHFRNYDATEIERILLDRARIGLKTTPAGTPSEIAAMTARNTNSDVRVAIKTLYLWALEPQTAIAEHFEKARRDIMFDVIRDLNDRNLLILRAVLDESDGFAKDVYETYRRRSAQVHEEPFSYMHFYSNLSYLQSLGLLVLISTKVNRTYTNRIQLTFDPSILDAVWTMRFA
ncbi:Cdc6/Cdc18 family protein [Anaerobaca lacustris]|uniref:Orc1/cdc6 family replication initiation protein n=1 Tax=Anaerobaca lacustris TaxID=3044600 RepID=A0AAW6U3I5_9BACT|nr:orc1/cdc6 family replication initiation protein [Sedimentisphaerales bacterium M17dextr]